MTTTPLLEVDDLHVRFPTGRGVVHAVNGVSFSVDPGERVAIVGESGSGKSVSALSLLGLTPRPGVATGAVRFKGRDLLGCSEAELSRVRGREAGLILQDATSALDPLQTIGAQIAESLWLHTDLDKAARRERALELLRTVHIADPEMRARQHAHELSGGMAQRAMIAAAIAVEPDLLVADEPTSALDATTADGVIELLTEIGRERGMAVLMITHDLGVVAKFAQRVIVMYAGRVVETAPVDELFSHPRHPYTRGLLQSVPGRRGREAVKAIPGGVPDLTALPSGCSFHPRCAHSGGRAVCSAELPLLEIASAAQDHRAACHFSAELGPLPAPEVVPAAAVTGDAPAQEPDALLRVEALGKRFHVKPGPTHRGGEVRAVNAASFTVRRGEVVALVGESGSGKTTTGKVILGLEDATSGTVVFDGQDITADRDRDVRRRIQVVFQNPDSSLDPRMRIEDIIAEPLEIHGIGTKEERRARVVELLEQVGLSADHVGRYPFEFSGGQRQRIAIARALAPKPDFLVCDEPVTALDVSVQAQILNLLVRIQREEQLALLFVAHDLSVVRQIADRVAVMYLGDIVECADADAFFAAPRHPYSAALLSSMSGPEARERVVLRGAIPSPFDPPSGCSFHTRCPKAQAACAQTAPETRAFEGGHVAACHFPQVPDPAPAAPVKEVAAS